MKMKTGQWKTYAFWILLGEAVGALSGWLTRAGMESYKAEITKPVLSPPSIVFPIVWVILYALMGIGAARIRLSRPSREQKRSLRLFLAQLAFNFFWSILFFNLRYFGLAFFWLAALWILILWMILSFRKTDPLSAWLQVPYLLWVAFAGYLNLGVWMLN